MIDKSHKGGASPADFNATEAIASQLKRYYKSVEQEPIPDQLLDLLEKLDQAERAGGTDGAN
ncbi:MAG: hypothetical protein VR78_04715 [Hoeflea sp. BRH_c9]|nr:MAG: hypothetical protein VR78_04715 [Hoeflea sp. BRH_c9]